MKPHIQQRLAWIFVRLDGSLLFDHPVWECVDRGRYTAAGYGVSPADAYKQWKLAKTGIPA